MAVEALTTSLKVLAAGAGAFRPVQYREARTAAYGLLFLGLVATLILSAQGAMLLADNLYGATCILAGATLFIGARTAHRRDSDAVNLVIAAETIIGIGIFSLVFSLGIGLIQLLNSPPDLEEKSLFDAVRPYLWPFSIGLILAALAPLFAVSLRNLEVDAPGASPKVALAQPPADTGGHDLADRFATRLQLAAEGLEHLHSTFRRTDEDWAVLGSRIEIAMAGLAVSVGTRGREVDEALSGMIASVGTKARAMDLAFDHLAASAGGQARVLEEAFGALAATIGQQARGMEDAFAGLSTAIGARVREVEASLDGLAAVVAARTRDMNEGFAAFRQSLSDNRIDVAAATERLATAGARLDEGTRRIDESMRGLAGRTEALGERLRESSLLLDGLRDMIAAVERFIRPDGTRP